MNNERGKQLIIDFENCTGCGECETACSQKHGIGIGAGQPRIRLKSFVEIVFIVCCQHCPDPPPCQEACFQGAIGRNEIFNAITISEKQCFGCGDCIDACPYGAIYMDDEHETAYKCNLCKGDPDCVKACAFEALTFGEATPENEATYKALYEKASDRIEHC
jgi:Fe-S-cluster-containing hydrogenase component 2